MQQILLSECVSIKIISATFLLMRDFFCGGCRGLNDAGQAAMLDVTDILSGKWASLSNQTVIRCWLKAKILPEKHRNAFLGKDTRLDRGDKEETAVTDDLCDMVNKMSMPEGVTDSRSAANVLTDNLFVERASGLTGRSAGCSQDLA